TLNKKNIFLFLFELTQESDVVFKEEAQIRNPVAQHRQALHPHAKGEAAVGLGVDTAVAKHLGMDHAAAHHLQPAGVATDPAALTPAVAALDIHLGGGLGEGEIGGPEAHRQV